MHKNRVVMYNWTHALNNSNHFLQDVGQAILESYSRVLESLAFNIVALIDDVLYADGSVKHRNK